MSSNTLNSDQAATPEVEAQTASLGVQLRAAREQAGLTSDELARRLCMTPSKLEALEQDELERFPGSTYVRGYIRNICRELGVDEAPVLAAFARQAPAEAPRAAQIPKGPVVGAGSASGGGSAFGPLVLVVAIAAAGGYWWMGQQGAPAAPQVQAVDAEPAEEPVAEQSFAVSSPEVLESELAEDFAPETDAQLADLSETSAESLEPELEAAGEAVVPVQEAAQVETVQPDPVLEEPEAAVESLRAVESLTADSASLTEPESQAPVTTSGAALALTFSEESWVEVTDATGNKILAKLQPAGSTIELDGQAPFSLMLGNAAATTVSYAGEVVESAPLGNRRTRKLTVGG